MGWDARWPRVCAAAVTELSKESMSPRSTIDPRESPDLGNRIRSIRQLRGLTLVKLARMSELSHPFLSQIERGLAQPSIASLGRIAHALGSSQVELLAGGALASSAPDQPVPRVGIVRGRDGSEGGFGAGQGRILVRGDVSFLPVDVRGERADFGDFFQHDEDEFLYVIDGSVKLDLGDDGLFTLETADSAYYKGGTQHRMCSANGEPYRVMIVKQVLGRASQG